MTTLTGARARAFAVPGGLGRRARVVALAAASLAVMTAGAAAMLLAAAATGLRARRLYNGILAPRVARAILRLWGVRLEVVPAPPAPGQQVVYVSNHASTLDLFVLVALALPNTRFFLSGWLRRVVPLGVIAHLMGTFWTVPQTRPAERRRIFARAARVLARTGESVYLSPEGTRVTTGAIGPFNKGAFHLATSLGAPIVPLYIEIPSEVDPGRGWDAGPGTVRVHVGAPVPTGGWTVEGVPAQRDRVRDLYVRWHAERRAARRAAGSGR